MFSLHIFNWLKYLRPIHLSSDLSHTKTLVSNDARSTMPVASTVQTPELFKGSLKEYQLKGLQWLVNCYEQVIRQSFALPPFSRTMCFLVGY